MKPSLNILILIFTLVFQSWSMNTFLWVEAGVNITMCESENSVAVNAQANSYSFVEWSTSGDGFFIFPNELSTFYYPGPGDVSTGVVSLYISVLTADNYSLTDSLILFIVRNPVSIAGNDASVCENECYQVEGQAFYNTSIAWTTTGDGYFSDAFMLNPYYFPGSTDISTGEVDLCLVSFPFLPCTQPDASCLILDILRIPLIEAGDDATICKYDNLYLEASAQNYDNILWQTSGDGTFNIPTIPDPIYEPGSFDKTVGNVILTLSLNSIFPCMGLVSDSLVLHLVNPPQVHAGFNQTLCKDQIAQMSATVSMCESILWITYGDGTFDNDTIFNPVYTPGQADLTSERVFLEINAFPVAPCTMTVGSYLFIELQNFPSVDAGEDVTVCGDSVTLNGLAENYEEIIWTTGGDGNFKDFTNLNSTYFFGPGDINAGIVSLTLRAIPIIPCMTIILDETEIVIDIPQIVTQCVKDTTMMAGQDLNMYFMVESIFPGYYTWYFNGIEIHGENSPAFNIMSVEPCHAGNYHCIFSNLCEEMSSNICMVKIHEEFFQEFYLPAGWSGLSSFVIPQNWELDSIFESMIENIILISDNSGIYFPAQNLNTLGHWMVSHGYQIKMEEPSYLVMNGFIEYPVQEISIPSGWSVLPFNFNQIVNVSWFFDTIPGVEIIKEMAGINVFWPAMNINTLNELIPGKSYLVFNKTQTPILINFSLSKNKADKRKIQKSPGVF